MSNADGDVSMTGQASGELAEAMPVVPSLSVQRVLQEDEVVLLVLRPHPWFMLVDGIGVYMLILLGSLFIAWLGHQEWSPLVIPESRIFPICASLVALRVIWKFIDWANRIYVLTDRRVIRRRGVVMLSIVEAPLSRIQNSAIYAHFLERLLGLGSIGFATAGNSGFEVVWHMIGDPTDIHRKVLEAIERYGNKGSSV